MTGFLPTLSRMERVKTFCLNCLRYIYFAVSVMGFRFCNNLAVAYNIIVSYIETYLSHKTGPTLAYVSNALIRIVNGATGVLISHLWHVDHLKSPSISCSTVRLTLILDTRFFQSITVFCDTTNECMWLGNVTITDQPVSLIYIEWYSGRPSNKLMDCIIKHLQLNITLSSLCPYIWTSFGRFQAKYDTIWADELMRHAGIQRRGRDHKI